MRAALAKPSDCDKVEPDSAILGIARPRGHGARTGRRAATVSWLLLQIETHWRTYLIADASDKKSAWYARNRVDLVRVLLERAGRTVPDLHHTVLALRLVTTLGGATHDALAPRQPRRRIDG